MLSKGRALGPMQLGTGDVTEQCVVKCLAQGHKHAASAEARTSDLQVTSLMPCTLGYAPTHCWNWKQGPDNSSKWAEPSGTVSAEGEPLSIVNTGKPAAHLIGIYQDSAEGEVHSTLMWESVRGSAFTTNLVKYHGHSLIVPKRGLYYVYCQVGFRGSECQEKPLTLSHQVYRRHDSYPQPLLLLTGTETVCGRSQGRGIWYTTLSHGAMVELEQDHHLYVNVSNPTLVDYLDGKTFFGVIKI
ncbi:lymphotoxin-beta-like isoform X1 [Hemitrygon akajei]|uniref:lymphotoxin-beta-like isoform X1 n=1 Tax=Hemitrygon akajei TaxID=2704970 RepID=UPI003BF99E85